MRGRGAYARGAYRSSNRSVKVKVGSSVRVPIHGDGGGLWADKYAQHCQRWLSKLIYTYLLLNVHYLWFVMQKRLYKELHSHIKHLFWNSLCIQFPNASCY